MTTATIIRVKSTVTALQCGRLGERYQVHVLGGLATGFPSIEARYRTPVCSLPQGHAEPCRWKR
jgi:hypothetical protein